MKIEIMNLFPGKLYELIEDEPYIPTGSMLFFLCKKHMYFDRDFYKNYFYLHFLYKARKIRIIVADNFIVSNKFKLLD